MTLRVDAHHHLWDLALTPQPWLAGAQFAAINRNFQARDYIEAAGAHVDRSIVVQTVADRDETPLLLELASRTELLGGVIGWVDLTAADVDEQLQLLRDSPGGEWLIGIRHGVQDEQDPNWLCRDDVGRGLAAVGRAGLAYDLLVVPAQLEAATTAAAAAPGVQFVVDHLSKPAIAAGTTEPWATAITRLAELPNVTCKLSGMVTEADWATWTPDDLRPYAEIVLDAFGAERVMFGSDWPVCELAGSYAAVVAAANDLTAALDVHERAAVFGTTAARVYGLDAAGDAAGPTSTPR